MPTPQLSRTESIGCSLLRPVPRESVSRTGGAATLWKRGTGRVRQRAARHQPRVAQKKLYPTATEVRRNGINPMRASGAR